jgi:PleD family two-component response regulator
VSVTDTGEGVKPSRAAGVGLTNIRERLKALYGSAARLVLEENAPRGVVASIEVPAAVAEHRTRVIADDEPLLRAQLRARLARSGPSSRSSTRWRTAATSTQVLDEHEPALFFLDIHMPGVNGLEAARAHRPRATSCS